MQYKILNHLFVIIASFLIISCNSTGNTENLADSLNTNNADQQTDEMATVTPDTLNTGTRSMIESLHYEIALQINMAKMAMENSENEAVKNLGKTITDQQTELNNKLNKIASDKNIEFTTSINPAMESVLDIYKSKKGADFDNSYLDWVVKTTEANMHTYEKEGPQLEVNELQQFVKNAIPILIQHHDAANALKNK